MKMSKAANARIWQLVHQERSALVEDLRGLGSEQWNAPSLCPGWSVHDVLAHLVDVAKTTRLGFARRMIAARFDFDRDNQAGVDRERRTGPAQTLAAFEAVLGRTSTPPADLATRLIEEIAHGEDIRRPLGIRRNYPIEAATPALPYLVKTSKNFGGGKERCAGLRLVATDADFSHGEGPEVRGGAVALLLALSGRKVDAAELDGPGSAEFLARLDG